MTDTNTYDYTPVEVALDDTPDLDDVHLEVAGVKLDLPNLNSAEMPIEVVQAVLLVKSKPVLDDETAAQVMAIFLAYFLQLKPNFGAVLRQTKAPLAYLTATVQAWAERSGLDPKAFRS